MSHLRHAFRSLGRTPWYSAAVSGVIALCMAFATTVFALVDGVLFKPLPYDRPGELYDVSGGFQQGQRFGIEVAPRNLRDWAEAAPGVIITGFMAGTGGAGNDDLRGWNPVRANVDQHFFEVLGIGPLIGNFQPQDFDSSERVSPAIISYDVWQGRFGGRPDVVGQPLSVAGGAGYRVVGVLPRGFLFPVRGRFQPDVLSPLVLAADERNDLRYRRVRGVARLPPGLSLSDYQARMDAAAVAEATDWVPRPSDGTPVFTRVGLTPIETFLTGQQRPVFTLVFATAAMLVLLGCLNVSGLMTSRVHDRAREFGVRRALGGSPRHLATLVLVENTVAATVGGLLGFALIGPMMALTLRLLPDHLGLLKPPIVDWRVIGFLALMVATASAVTSLWPIRKGLRAASASALTDVAQPTVRTRSVGRSLLVAGQVALGLMLTLGGVLLVGSLVQVWRTNPGFRADRLLVLSGFVRGRSIADRAQAINAFTDDVRRMPGVEAVAATASPLIGHGVLMNAFVDGATYAVTPGFFEAMGLTLIDGRWLTTAEIQSGAAVAVVSAKVATRIAGSERAVGRQIKGYRNQVPQPFTVVGVVADARLGSWDQEGQGQVYGPYLATADQISVRVIVRAEGARNLIAPLMQRLAGDTGSVQIRSVGAAEDLLDETVRGRRLESWLFGAFAVAALVIVGVGLFGLMAMTTAKRTREIGIRIALGARQHAIVRLLLGEQLPAIVFGLAAGGLVSVWAVRFVKSGLYQLAAYDPRIWTAAFALMLGAAAFGAAIPSLMASNTDPVKALRAD